MLNSQKAKRLAGDHLIVDDGRTEICNSGKHH